MSRKLLKLLIENELQVITMGRLIGGVKHEAKK